MSDEYIDILCSGGPCRFIFPKILGKDEKNRSLWEKFFEHITDHCLGNEENNVWEDSEGFRHETFRVKASRINQILPMGHLPKKDVVWCVKTRKEVIKKKVFVVVHSCKKKRGSNLNSNNDDKTSSYLTPEGKAYFGVPWVGFGDRERHRSGSFRQRSRSPRSFRQRSRSPRSFRQRSRSPVRNRGFYSNSSENDRYPPAFSGGYPPMARDHYFRKREEELKLELEILKVRQAASYGPPPPPAPSLYPEFITVPTPSSVNSQYPVTNPRYFNFWEDKVGAPH